MPRKFMVQVTCDVCGAETDDAKSIFSLNGQEKEGDFCKKHRKALHDALAPFLEVGHKPERPKRGRPKKSLLTPVDLSEDDLTCKVPGCMGGSKGTHEGPFVAKNKGGLTRHITVSHNGNTGGK